MKPRLFFVLRMRRRRRRMSLIDDRKRVIRGRMCRKRRIQCLNGWRRLNGEYWWRRLKQGRQRMTNSRIRVIRMSPLNQWSRRLKRFDELFADCLSGRRRCRNCRQWEYQRHVDSEWHENLNIQLIRTLLNEKPSEKSEGFSFVRGYVMDIRDFRSGVNYFTAN